MKETIEYSVDLDIDVHIPSPGRWRKGKKAYKRQQYLWNNFFDDDERPSRLSHKVDTLAMRYLKWKDSNTLDQHWMCSCGNYEESGLHCSLCGNQPPWGCPCSGCDSYNDEEECVDSEFDF
jgi:hypothetical protein